MGRLEGQRAVITGAGSGLGREVAVRFAREGAAALALVDIDGQGLERTAELLGPDGPAVRAVVADVADPEALGEPVAAFAADVGGLDVVVNNAGVLSPSARVHNTLSSDLRRVLDVNVLGTFHGMQAGLAVMRAGRAPGAIVNTASVAGITPWSHAGPYCASKAAVIQLTRVAALEYAREGIRVNCVCPGTFRSGIHGDMAPEVLDQIAARHPMGRLGEVEEIAGAFVYLASAEASFVTGAAITVDGGYAVR